jgi:hypothetical protein
VGFADRLRCSLSNNVRRELRTNLCSELRTYVRGELRANLRSQLCAEYLLILPVRIRRSLRSGERVPQLFNVCIAVQLMLDVHCWLRARSVLWLQLV